MKNRKNRHSIAIIKIKLEAILLENGSSKNLLVHGFLNEKIKEGAPLYLSCISCIF